MHTIGYNWFSNPDVQHKNPSNSPRLSCVGHLFIVRGLRKSFAYPAGRRPFFVCLTSSNPLEAVWPDTITPVLSYKSKPPAKTKSNIEIWACLLKAARLPLVTSTATSRPQKPKQNKCWIQRLWRPFLACERALSPISPGHEVHFGPADLVLADGGSGRSK